jgi:hypothetical protein
MTEDTQVTGPKNYRIVVKCTRSTFIRFRRYAADFSDYEKALDYLLTQAERLNLHPGRYY